MITSKQRAYLRGLANKITPIFQIGKGGINENMIRQIDNALEKRELIKLHVLENSLMDTRSACDEIVNAVGAEPVIVIGSKFAIYRESKDYKEIVLPR